MAKFFNWFKEWYAIRKAMRSFRSGEWVPSQMVQKGLHMTFSECFSKFEFSRTAEWWSLVGETEEEKQRDGQKITTYFRIKK